MALVIMTICWLTWATSPSFADSYNYNNVIQSNYSSSSSSNTCDLFISSRGVTEKVASGHLSTFLAHVRAVRERYAGNSHTAAIRLHGPLVRKEPQRPWFTKMTVHRLSIEYIFHGFFSRVLMYYLNGL
mgnify:CR=1 FL=1